MPKILDTPLVINDTLPGQHITYHGMDHVNGIIHVVFDRLNAAGQVVLSGVTHTIIEPETTQAIARASQIAASNGGNVYEAIKTALYEFLPGNGVIS